jgi:hypothetical protein
MEMVAWNAPRVWVVLIAFMLFCVTTATAGIVTVNATLGNAFFGNPTDPNDNPLVAGITVAGPTTITISATGCETNGADVPECTITPNGYELTPSDWGGEDPLQEAGVVGTAVGTVDPNFAGLIGAFVPAATADNPSFVAIDSTKPQCSVTDVCIDPTLLFFVGDSDVYNATQAGTLFLGINDWLTYDNGGSFSVTLTAGSSGSVPEPTSVGLLGTVLLGVAAVIRRKYRAS